MCVYGKDLLLAWLYKETGIYLRNHFKMGPRGGSAFPSVEGRGKGIELFKWKLYLESQYINQIKAELFGLVGKGDHTTPLLGRY